MLVENELKKLKTFDSFYFKGKDNFEEDYLVFKPMYKYFLKSLAVPRVFQKSKGLTDEDIKPPNNTIAPTVKFTG